MDTRKRVHHRRRPKAATQDVLGRPPDPRIYGKWRKHYERLAELHELLTRRRADLVENALSEQPTFSTHMADAGTDTYDRDLALGVLSSEQDAIYQVDQALDRIRSGSYGVCELTGRLIEQERLEAVPWTRFSAAAERKLEREGLHKLARLGPRETVGRESTTKVPGETA